MGEPKPWLETWTCTVDGPAVDVEQVSISGIAGAFHGLYDVGQAAHGRLIAAAPALVRALLAAEWGSGMGIPEGEDTCPACQGFPGTGHDDEPTGRCIIDAALSAAGLDTAEKRCAARAEIARMAK